MKITVVGAGGMGTALVKKLAVAGHDIRITSRDAGKARLLAAGSPRVQAFPAESALGGANVVIIATPYAGAVNALRLLGDLTGKIVIDISNPMNADSTGLKIGHTTSAAEEIARALPGVEVVKAFNTVFAQVIEDGPLLDGNQVTVFYAGDSERARQTVRVLIESIGFKAIDAGKLKNARYLEPMGALNIHFGYGAGAGTAIAPTWIGTAYSSLDGTAQVADMNPAAAANDTVAAHAVTDSATVASPTRMGGTTEMHTTGSVAITHDPATQAALMPTLFLSHGSPMLALVDSPARRFLQKLGKTLPRPKAIVMFSAHWESIGGPAVSFAAAPETIHDFGGFPEALFAMQYPAKGMPDTAARAAALLEQSGFNVKRSATRGLDHGAWVPLQLMYPDADIPVLQVSILRGASPAVHEQLGRSLAVLRSEGVLIVGSGSLTHNLYEFRRGGIDAGVPDWVSEFGDWMKTALQNDDRDALRNYRTQAPSAERNHPTEEHLLPLFVAMGAAGETPHAERLHASYEYGVLAMDAYAF